MYQKCYVENFQLIEFYSPHSWMLTFYLWILSVSEYEIWRMWCFIFSYFLLHKNEGFCPCFCVISFGEKFRFCKIKRSVVFCNSGSKMWYFDKLLYKRAKKNTCNVTFCIINRLDEFLNLLSASDSREYFCSKAIEGYTP